MLTACLAQISLAYLLSAILLIYRIKKMDCKAIIHLLCNEITLHFRVSSHCAWVRCRAAWHRCWCDGLALHSHVHPYSFQGLPNLRDHLAQVVRNIQVLSHVSGCPMEAEPAELKMSPVVRCRGLRLLTSQLAH